MNQTKLHEHHVVPRAYGGEDGPTVTLCAECHGLIHELADGLWHTFKRKGAWTVRLEKQLHLFDPQVRQKLTYLVHVIMRARLVTLNTKNKAITFSAKFKPDVARMLKVLTKRLHLSQQKVVVTAITALYSATNNSRGNNNEGRGQEQQIVARNEVRRLPALEKRPSVVTVRR
jgi:hypothetical protein